GVDDLCVMYDADRIAAMAFLVANTSTLTVHWRTVLRVAVHPSLQGGGVGRRLMEGVHEIAQHLGVEHLVLSVRDGHGLPAFYERCGYRIYGTHPGAVRVAPDDTRDEILLVIDL
ncbi:MAG: GNAT family N-acetyltransferase, partial [Actinomycetota bacterium]|nr:GNAT family N-acetyltransferase [Actinomycetota bacterium]